MNLIGVGPGELPSVGADVPLFGGLRGGSPRRRSNSLRVWFDELIELKQGEQRFQKEFVETKKTR